jgi:hypothetical protein
MLFEEFTLEPMDLLPLTCALADRQRMLCLQFGVEYVTSEIDKCYYPKNDHHNCDLAKSILQNLEGSI